MGRCEHSRGYSKKFLSYHPTMKNRIIHFMLFGLASLLCVTWLAACGQKGPLYLPDKNSIPQQSKINKHLP